MLPGAAALSSPQLLLLRPSTAASAPLQSGNRFGASNASLPFTLLVSPRIPSFLAKLERPRLCVHSKLDSQGLWEEPDDGNDSEYDEMDGEEIEDDERTATDAKDVDSQYEALAKEVQVLLGPAEKAILQQNEAPDLSKISTMKWPAFHSLALSIQIPFMDELLEYGVHIDSVDKDGFTALHKAVMGKKEAVISHLLRKGANPHVKDKDGATPLHYAVQVGALQTVKLLIKYRVDVNVADDDGWTPLHVAIQSRSRDIAKVLLVNGADKTRRNKDGKTPLDLGLCYGRDFKSYELTKLLKLVPANRDP